MIGNKFCSNCGGQYKVIRQTGYTYYLRCLCCGEISTYTDELAKEINKQNVVENINGEDLFNKVVNSVFEIECLKDISSGTGFLISEGGIALTCAHVVVNDNMEVCEDIIAFVGLRKQKAKVTILGLGDSEGGYGNGLDFALVSLDPVPSNAIPCEIGDSTIINNGAKVYVVGNSLGEGISITSGIVSDCNRISYGKRTILTDSTANPGNSGGPLFNSRGQVIGVMVSKNSRGEGMSYAIPIDDVLGLLNKQ
jgi:S1-C subfamily serine protease